MRTRLASVSAIAAAVLSSSLLTSAAAPSSVASTGAASGACGSAPSAARVMKGATAQEPALYSAQDAKMYGVVKDAPRLPNGSVHIPTVFHVVSDHALAASERTRMQDMISAQMQVLNDSYAGRTAPDAADSPFRFDLTKHDVHREHALVHRRARARTSGT